MTNARYCINVLDKNRIFDIHLNQTLFRLKKILGKMNKKIIQIKNFYIHLSYAHSSILLGKTVDQ